MLVQETLAKILRRCVAEGEMTRGSPRGSPLWKDGKPTLVKQRKSWSLKLTLRGVVSQNSCQVYAFVKLKGCNLWLRQRLEPSYERNCWVKNLAKSFVSEYQSHMIRASLRIGRCKNIVYETRNSHLLKDQGSKS